MGVFHRAGTPDEERHRYHADRLAEADALLFGRVTYIMMEEAWRPLAETGVLPEGMADWVAGHGPYLLAGLSAYVDLKLVSRHEFDSGAVALRYVPRR